MLWSSIGKALKTLAGRGVLPQDTNLSRITVEAPRDPAHGDVTTNAAMVLAKPAGRKPRDLAEEIAALLREDADIESVDIAGPGFINMRLSAAFWPRLMDAVLELGEAYGRSDLGRGLKVNVEYVSANPTGPLHVGHCRGAVFGDALANLLEETPERRWTFWPAPPFSVIARRSARTSERFPPVSIPAPI